mmetsp:Transcript_20755/g.29227  ORF Transcript_20755/g.29227 Transcript_20755/m.29227 type:complete len:335 (-) Transcript_20755:2520-3524(-)
MNAAATDQPFEVDSTAAAVVSGFKTKETSEIQFSEYKTRIEALVLLLERNLNLQIEEWIAFNYPVAVARGFVIGKFPVCVKVSVNPDPLRKEGWILDRLERTCTANSRFFPQVLLVSQFHDCRARHSDTPTVLLTEWIQNEPVSRFLASAKQANGEHDERVRKFALQLVFLLHYLRRARIASRDIKPSNLLWYAKFETLYICDFDLGESLTNADVQTRSARRYQVAGTPGFQDPSLTPKDYLTPHDLFAADLYSAAVTLLSLTGQVPENRVQHHTVPELLTLALRTLHPNNRSSFADLTAQMCQEPAESRPTPETLLLHPFLTSDPALSNPPPP